MLSVSQYLAPTWERTVQQEPPPSIRGLEPLVTSLHVTMSTLTSTSTAKKITGRGLRPLFVMHAEETAVYPVEPAYRLYREARGPKEIHIVNAGHTIMDRRMEAISQAMDWVSDQLTQAE